MEGDLVRAKVAIIIDWEDPGGTGRTSAASVAHGIDALEDALLDALDRCGFPRVCELLAKVVARHQDSRTEPEREGEICRAETAFAEAATAVVAAWKAHDERRNEQAAKSSDQDGTQTNLN
jgi:hypothetical protein